MNGILDKFIRMAPATAAYAHKEDFVKEITQRHGSTREAANALWNEMRRQEIWRNSEYQVIIDREVHHGFGAAVGVIYLSIKRIDRAPIHDWRDLQRIKTALIGPEHEAIELYPAESRLLDASNQYHLFAFTNPDGGPQMIPLGFTGARAVTGEREAERVGARQRPLP